MAHTDDRKAALIAELARARSRAAANSRALSGDMNVSDKMKGAIAGHRGVWLGSAVLLGLVISKLPPRTKKVIVDRRGERRKEVEEAGKASLALGALKVLIDLTKPAIMTWATKRISEAAAGRNPRR